MEDYNAIIAAQMDAFRAIEAELAKEHVGEYVLFKDGPHSFYKEQVEAYEAGIRLFGDGGGFVAPLIQDPSKPRRVIRMGARSLRRRKLPSTLYEQGERTIEPKGRS